MNKFLIAIPLVFLSTICNSQTKGAIEFEEKMKMNMVIEDTDEMGDMAEHFPKEITMNKILYFNQEVSLYIPDKSKTSDATNHEVSDDGSGPRFVMKVDEPDVQVYCDLLNRNRIEKRDLFGRQFLIESSFDQMEWKLSGNQKKILDYSCQEAILKDSTVNLKVWFSPSLPFSTGPNGNCNLPGMILESIRDDGKQVITAKRIILGDFDETVLVKPSGGKKISKDEFNKLAEEKQKEMMDENGGGNEVIIKIRH